jgi:hypothetical protein
VGTQVDETQATNKLSLSREAAALRIGELDLLFTQRFSKNVVLFSEVRDHSTLLSLQPTSGQGDDEMQGPDFHRQNLSRSFENVGDHRHRPNTHVCGIMGRSNI